MKNKKIVITIGVPAYNEEKSIRKTLNSLLSQHAENYQLQKTVVISDASTDKTDYIVRQFKHKKIELLRNNSQIGKTGCIKKLLQYAETHSSNYLVIIDADLTIRNSHVISALVSEISENPKRVAVSGFVSPLRPKTFSQRIGYFGFQLWESMIQRSGEKELYFRSSDPFIILKISAFSQKNIHSFSYMHDEFYYLYAKKLKKEFSFTRNAHIEFKLPTSISDYIYQMKRYIGVHMTEDQRKKLPSEMKRFSRTEKLIGWMYSLQTDFPAGVAYIILQILIHIFSKLQKTNLKGGWAQVTSTK